MTERTLRGQWGGARRSCDSSVTLQKCLHGAPRQPIARNPVQVFAYVGTSLARWVKCPGLSPGRMRAALEAEKRSRLTPSSCCDPASESLRDYGCLTVRLPLHKARGVGQFPLATPSSLTAGPRIHSHVRGDWSDPARRVGILQGKAGLPTFHLWRDIPGRMLCRLLSRRG